MGYKSVRQAEERLLAEIERLRKEAEEKKKKEEEDAASYGQPKPKYGGNKKLMKRKW